MPPTAIPQGVLKEILAQDARHVPDGVRALAEAAREGQGDRCAAILFHGSCLRTGTDEGLVDLYLLTARKSRVLRVLLPDVFYLETSFAGRVLRAKLSRLSLDDFERGTAHWFHSYLWGRFAQPSVLLFVRDDASAARVCNARARAVLTFIDRVLPRVGATFTARSLWSTGLRLTYLSELRVEKPAHADDLVEADASYYEKVTPPALAALPLPIAETPAVPGRFHVRISGGRRFTSLLSWRIRMIQGKVFSMLRLAKAGFTFEGGMQYVLWKIERHSGMRIEAGPLLRHCPPLAHCIVLWKLFRRGAFR